MSQSENLFSELHSTLNNINLIIKNISDSIKKITYNKKDYSHSIDDFSKQIHTIEEKLDDPTFYVGIIGEASCGKSTFINAFIEHRYLFEDILPETTCANTIIQYGIEENVIVEYNNGRIKKFDNAFTKLVSGLQSALGSFIPKLKKEEDKNQKREQMREMLRTVTAVEESAKNISSVTLVFPFEVLKDGFVIVDTPGIGSVNPRHTEVARRGAAECDALLILTNLQATVLSKDLMTAVREIAGSSAENCIFVGTHLDLLPQEERKRMENYFETKLSTFGRQCPYYMVSSEAALKELEAKTQPAEDTAIGLEAFRSFRGEIKEHLKRNRQHIQAKKVTLLIAELIKNLDTALTERQEAFTQQREKFQQMVIPENSDFWDSWLHRMKKQYADSSRESEYASHKYIDELTAKMQEEIIENIYSCEDTDDLDTYLKEGIEDIIDKYNKQISAQSARIDKALNKAAEKAQREFIKSCKSKYHELEVICGSPAQIQQGTSSNLNSSLLTSSGLQEFNAVAEKIASDENSNIVKGLAAGAAISFMIPGVGWIAGGLLTLAGGAMGWLFSSLEEQQKEAMEKAEEFTAKFHAELTKNLSSTYRQKNSYVQKCLEETLNENKYAYTNAVKYYNEDLKNKAEAIANTVAYIHTQKVLLSQVANNVCEIQAKAERQLQQQN